MGTYRNILIFATESWICTKQIKRIIAVKGLTPKRGAEPKMLRISIMEMIDQLGEKPRNLRYYNTGLKSKKEVGCMIYRYSFEGEGDLPGVSGPQLFELPANRQLRLMRNRCYRAPSMRMPRNIAICNSVELEPRWNYDELRGNSGNKGFLEDVWSIDA